MTAPNTATNAEAMPTDLDAAMGFVLKDTMAQTAADMGEGSLTPARNEKGQFVAASGDTTAIPPAQQPEPVVPAEGTPAAGEGEGSAEGEAAFEIPEGYTAPPALPDDKARGFKVSDAEGEIVAPDLTWELTANGKPRTLSTDKLVAYAQMGVYNHEREQQTQAIQQRAQQVERHAQTLEQAVQERDQQIERLLSDSDFLLRAQMAYESQNTPEARWQRERDQMAEKEQGLELQRAAIQTEQFINTSMTPALDLLLKEYPTVSADELAAKFFLAADPYRRNGVLMPHGHDALKRWVVYNLEPEVRALHESRAAERQAPAREIAVVKDKAKADVAAAEVKAQRAKNQTARTLRPAGRAMAETKAPPKVTSLKDAESVIMSETMAQMRAG